MGHNVVVDKGQNSDLVFQRASARKIAANLPSPKDGGLSADKTRIDPQCVSF